VSARAVYPVISRANVPLPVRTADQHRVSAATPSLRQPPKFSTIVDYLTAS
jgi:hypothetical protein